MGRLFENPKTGGSREVFLPENNFKSFRASFEINFRQK